MKPAAVFLVLPLLGVSAAHGLDFVSASSSETPRWPLGQPGLLARYQPAHAAETVSTNSVTGFALALGPIETHADTAFQWLRIEVTKPGISFRVWLLTSCYPPFTLAEARASTGRYLLQESDSAPVEFLDEFSRKAVLPSIGGWQHLWPRTLTGQSPLLATNTLPAETRYLGRRFLLQTVQQMDPEPPPRDCRIVELLPDVLVGVASNTRQKDERRRYDNSDYDLVKLARSDYFEMAGAGINCLKVDSEQLPWVQDLNVFYWGPGIQELPFPECLYRSTYLGSTLFLDEPAVGTRDYIIRPRLTKDPEFRKSITPRRVFSAFQEHFEQALKAASIRGIFGEPGPLPGVDSGATLVLENLFSWETMVSTAAYELSRDALVPSAMVFEPPGRVGTLRTLPEMDMTYGCQIPVDDPKYFTDIIYGFLRGAARLTGKNWGTSIYGAVDRADAFWYLTRAYDLGATRFFFWDNAKIACVPYHECLGLARDLRAHAENYPFRNLTKLKRAAEVAILLPPGYNLGHVHLGKGSLWGLPELNLERKNEQGVPYRTVMSQFFTEIERCLRLGVAFDLLWDLPALDPSGYREVVRVREDGKVEIMSGSKRRILQQARTPARPVGMAPDLAVEVRPLQGSAPLEVNAAARVLETSAPVFYTYGTDHQGVYRNAMVAWELFGPGAEDYRVLQPEGLRPNVLDNGASSEVTVSFRLPRAGHYRLRVATVDLAGRSAVSWNDINVRE